VRRDLRLRGINLAFALFDREDRAGRRAIRSLNNDARALQLAEHACEPALRVVAGFGRDGEGNVRHPR
jgi:hypothetical protein